MHPALPTVLRCMRTRALLHYHLPCAFFPSSSSSTAYLCFSSSTLPRHPPPHPSRRISSFPTRSPLFTYRRPSTLLPFPSSSSSPSSSLSSFPFSPSSLHPHRPFITQTVVLAVALTAGYFLRRKYLEIRAMRPDLQSSPRDPATANPTAFHDGGFQDKMDRREAALILGVRENASRERIMERYRQLMKVNHPDLGGSPYVSTKINEAKELLSKTARSEEQERRARR